MSHRLLSRARLRRLREFAGRVEVGTSRASPAQVVARLVRPLLEEAFAQHARAENAQEGWRAARERVECQEQEISALRERIAQFQDELFHARNAGGA